MNYIERLDQGLKHQLRQPWSQDRSGGERVWFLVFDPDKLRSVMANRELFRQTTEAAGKRWAEIDLSTAFGTWMQQHRYAERYFARPSRAHTIIDDFAEALVLQIRERMQELAIDDQTLLVITGTESLFGISKVSHITRLIEDDVPGRLLVFFPGEYSEPQYRFLDARDGWNYLAVPITPASGRKA
jgi:hypothetical protein